MRRIAKLKGKKDDNKGITLIALVITIIVLLILAAVSIATLTGENGILTKANAAKTETTIAQEKEQVQLAYMAALTKKNYNGKITVDELNNELKELNEEATAKEENNSFIVTFSKTGNSYRIDDKGNVTGPINQGGNVPNPSEPTIETEKGKTFDINTEIQDKYGNKLTIPEGFKITEDSADDVTGGVVIEDVSNSATAGSQFVWIPVGTIYTNKEKTESKTIALGQYFLEVSGTGSESMNYELLDEEGLPEEKENERLLIASVNKTGGYYIGRYEARTEIERTTRTNDSELGQVTVRGNEYVYNYVTQSQATKLSSEMYGKDKQFTSELVSRCSFSTAVKFIEEFSGNSEYSIRKSSRSRSNKGTNNLSDASKHDNLCNIWDMSDNMSELLRTINGNNEATAIGGCFTASKTTDTMGGLDPMTDAERDMGFRMTIVF